MSENNAGVDITKRPLTVSDVLPVKNSEKASGEFWIVSEDALFNVDILKSRGLWNTA